MNKNDLIAGISAREGLKKDTATRVFDTTFDLIAESLQGGNEVRIIGFGTFYVNRRQAGKVRNPRTGEMTNVAAQNQPKFRAGKGLKSAVN